VGSTVPRSDIGHPARQPHSTGVAAQRRVRRTAPGSDSQAVSGDRRGGDLPLTRVPAVGQSI
jgi:hypothetical protein